MVSQKTLGSVCNVEVRSVHKGQGHNREIKSIIRKAVQRARGLDLVKMNSLSVHK